MSERTEGIFDLSRRSLAPVDQVQGGLAKRLTENRLTTRPTVFRVRAL